MGTSDKGRGLATQVLKCERHGESTRLSCADCQQPICPRCMVRTEVGLKCKTCAAPMATLASTSRRSRLPIALSSAGLALVALMVGLLALRSPPGEKRAALAPVGRWTEAPGLVTIRGTTTAVVLEDGAVLAAGGGVGAIALPAVEAFDPAAGLWHSAAPLVQARRGHQAVMLDDGRVLVAGGLFEGRPLASAEVYDPATGSWAPVEPMAIPRLGHSLTVLGDGRILAAGGSSLGADGSDGDGQVIRSEASAEIFDPAAGNWSFTGVMGSSRFEHTATSLDDGRVVIAGGLGSVGDGDSVGPLRTTEIYDPAAGVFLTATDMAEGRTNHAAAGLADGSVIVSGGVGGERGDISLASAEIFDSRGGTWTTAGAMGSARTGHTATGLDDGRVLVAGGESVHLGSRRSLTSAEVFEPARAATGEWRSAGDMACPRSEQAAVLLGDGSVLVMAGDAAFPRQPPKAQSCVERYRL